MTKHLDFKQKCFGKLYDKNEKFCNSICLARFECKEICNEMS